MASDTPTEMDGAAPEIDSTGHRSAAATCPNQAVAAIAQTPGPGSTKKKKGVRFSDPGPARGTGDTHLDTSTGLTPHVSRTRIDSDGENLSRRKKKARRHTAPVATDEAEPINLESLPSPGSRVLCQWLPMDDRLDRRSMSRIRRSGLSEGINRIYDEKRTRKRKEREWEEELTSLKKRLRDFEDTEPTAEDLLAGEENDVAQTRRRLFNDDPAQTTSSSDHRSPMVWPDNFDAPESDGTTMITDDDTRENSALDTPLTTLPTTPTDAGAQTSFTSPCREAELEKLNKDLEQELVQRKLEKQQLFKEWQQEAQSQKFLGIVDPDKEDSGSPPPDLANQVIATLKTAGTRAADAVRDLEDIYRGLSGHGFDGTDVPEIVASIGAHFRQARMELERELPGETTQADFSNWKDVLETLVERVHRLVRQLHDARKETTCCEDRESALRHQFDATLLRLEVTAKKNASLEEYSEEVAEDMLHARMNIQNLEKEKENQESDKTRLQEALEKYRDDLKMLENLNSQLEDQVAALKRHGDESREIIIGDLRADLVREGEMRNEMQTRLDGRNVDISNLHTKIQELETEKREAITYLEHSANAQYQCHEQKVGVLNARLSEVTTSLDEAVHEKKTLLCEKARLEDRLKALERVLSGHLGEVHARLSQTAQDFAEWQKNEAQLEIDCDGDTEPDDGVSDNKGEAENKQSFSAIGGEPITPATESRFKNVVFARGKKRKQPPIDTLYEEEENVD